MKLNFGTGIGLAFIVFFVTLLWMLPPTGKELINIQQGMAFGVLMGVFLLLLTILITKVWEEPSK